SEENAFLDPGVDTPAGSGARVGLGGAHLPGRQLRPQARERITRRFTIRVCAGRRQRFDVVCQAHARRAPPALAEAIAVSSFSTAPFKPSSTSRIRARDDSLGGTIGSRYTSSSSPIAAIALLTGIGFDSMKFTVSSGNRSAWTRRAAAKSLRSAASTMRT